MLRVRKNRDHGELYEARTQRMGVPVVHERMGDVSNQRAWNQDVPCLGSSAETDAADQNTEESWLILTSSLNSVVVTLM